MPEKNLPPREVKRWQGMHHDARALLDRNPVQKALFAQNFYVDDGRWVGRLGTDQLGSQLAASKIQGVTEFQEIDGTIHILAFCNADMFEWNTGTNSWDQTDLSAQGVTVDPSADLDFANSRGRLVVTDGVNTPWMWDPTVPSFTTLSEAPVAQGVEIYYDKVFFYNVSGSAISFEWSDEGDPTNGYDADGQSWEFVQTDAGSITSLRALNEMMLVFKEDSGAFLRGRVNQQFQTDAVREGLSETEGSISRDSPVVLDGDVFFLSQNGPRAAVGGQKLARINEDENGDDRLKDTWSTLDRNNWSNAHGVIDTKRRHILWFIPDDDIVLVYGVGEDTWQTFKFPWYVEDAANVEFPGGDEFIIMGDDNGNVYRYGKADIWTDAGGNAIKRILESPLYGQSFQDQVKRLVELRVTMDLTTDIDFEVSPVVDGDTKDGIQDTLANRTGRQKYRRGFNNVGVALGWKFVMNTKDQTVNIESAATFQTLVGTYPDFQ